MTPETDLTTAEAPPEPEREISAAGLDITKTAEGSVEPEKPKRLSGAAKRRLNWQHITALTKARWEARNPRAPQSEPQARVPRGRQGVARAGDELGTKDGNCEP